MKYTCWRPDHGEEPEDGEVIEDVGVYRRHEEAAELYVEKNFSDWSYPTDVDVMVQVEGEEPVSVHVAVESVPSFYGVKKR